MNAPHTVRIPPEALRAAVGKVGLKPEHPGAARYTNALMAAAPLIVAAYLEELADTPVNLGPWWALDSSLRQRAADLRKDAL